MDNKELLDRLRDWVDLYFHEMNCSDKGLQETLEHNNLAYHEIIGIINASGEKRTVSRTDFDEWVDFLWHSLNRKDIGLLGRRLEYILNALGREVEER